MGAPTAPVPRHTLPCVPPAGPALQRPRPTTNTTSQSVVMTIRRMRWVFDCGPLLAALDQKFGGGRQRAHPDAHPKLTPPKGPRVFQLHGNAGRGREWPLLPGTANLDLALWAEECPALGKGA